MFRASRVLLSALKPLKTTTGITGLEVHPNPLPALLSTYSSTLSLLSSLPETSVYRQATEAIVKHRQSVIEKAAGDIQKVEGELEAGQIEEVLDSARDELALAGKMAEWKTWEPLQQKPAEGQWQYFERLSE